MSINKGFKWIKVFNKLAEKFLGMHNNNNDEELLKILRNVADNDEFSNLICEENKDKNISEGIFNTMDKKKVVFPFTALIYVATQYGSTKSAKFYNELCKKLDIKGDLSADDFAGIPLISHGWTNFTKEDYKKFDTWERFDAVFKLNQDADGNNFEIIIEGLKDDNIKLNSSTSVALFLVNPNKFFPMDTVTRAALNQLKIKDGDSDLKIELTWDFYNEKYDTIAESIKKSITKKEKAKYNSIKCDFALFSHLAWLRKIDIPMDSHNIILYGPPGTGKTYSIKEVVDIICLNESREYYNTDQNAQKDFYDHLIEKNRLAFITFHQSYGYEDFIEGIKPVIIDKDGNEINNDDKNALKGSKMLYKVCDGVFKRFCDKAKTDKNNIFFFIIDEINRGNISKIFGELITLIEESKRDKMSVTLPCSGESFTVPSNVYIIGTMNTADRSIALLDTALRRRFDFVEMMPRPELLSNDCEGVDLEKMLKTINERISVLLDREHTIGHAYFMKLDENGESVSIKTLDELKRVFKYDIIPLLQEYFFDDYENIQIVLKEKNSSKANDKHTFISKITTSGITDISSYSFNSIDDFTKEDFIRIYK